MKIFRKQSDLRTFLDELRERGKKIGFVPSMGALHEGHISLIRKSMKKCDVTVASIFVNPSQFNDPEDLRKYPRPISMDIQMLTDAKCDILYLPEITDVYGRGKTKPLGYKIGYLENILEGASRKGHFRGVVQVVSKLLDIVKPHSLFLGQKDYQQLIILSDYVRRKKLKTKVVRCDIVREKNGLAMSSRNERLSPELRQKAGIIYSTLKSVVKNFREKPVAELIKKAIAVINKIQDFKVDYLELRDAETLKPSKYQEKKTRYILVTSVIVGGVRLLDNVLIGKDGK